MPQLILVRHAKSDWGEPGLRDHDRPLNARGERDAPVLAARLAVARDADPDAFGIARVLSSTAQRARSTAEHFGAALGIPVEFDEALYLAPAETLLATAAAANVDGVLLVAHDPGISGLAHRLSSGGIDRMPTCAVARFAWRGGTWAEAITRPAEAWSVDAPREGRRG
ncbi:SixA phosphatase family protein [Leucobacter massiliensis]|uniref:Phosphohistidine phosphatase n=1 Tax=Leucobacter massiliensis TaxID=1686285 RepID=A0A2S9QKC1_9MICO|nr:histidine phosphatase family protein [Leucobacter massiliensis]PRI10036.1 phosphohistidine phosphatase [Leucobacter massiliensis]PRI10051.1 phosphohistidine phosphatase [Leucobacter massiliensis]